MKTRRRTTRKERRKTKKGGFFSQKPSTFDTKITQDDKYQNYRNTDTKQICDNYMFNDINKINNNEISIIRNNMIQQVTNFCERDLEDLSDNKILVEKQKTFSNEILKLASRLTLEKQFRFELYKKKEDCKL
jgi:hypothetical protein